MFKQRDKRLHLKKIMEYQYIFAEKHFDLSKKKEFLFQKSFKFSQLL
jgi:hypothetical protein